MSEANNITFAQAKTSFFYRPKVKRKYNTLHLAGKEVCKKDEENLVLFELNIKLLYGRDTNGCLFLLADHLGLEPRTDRLYSLRTARTYVLGRSAPCIASRCAHGAIFARSLMSVLIDSASLDYVAETGYCGRCGRRPHPGWPTDRNKKAPKNRGVSVGGPSRTRT